MTNDVPAARTVRAAVVQSAPVLFDTLRTLDKLADLTADAARRGAELVVFPEAFVGGYPKGHDFGVSLGLRTPEGRDDFRRLFENAIDVPGPATERIGSVARQHAVHLVVGVIERTGGTLYCSSLTFGPDGRLLGKHRKLIPTAMERVIWGTGDGSTLPVIDTPLGLPPSCHLRNTTRTGIGVSSVMNSSGATRVTPKEAVSGVVLVVEGGTHVGDVDGSPASLVVRRAGDEFGTEQHPALAQGVADDKPAVREPEQEDERTVSVPPDDFVTAGEHGFAAPRCQENAAADELRVGCDVPAVDGCTEGGKLSPLVADDADFDLAVAFAARSGHGCSGVVVPRSRRCQMKWLCPSRDGRSFYSSRR